MSNIKIMGKDKATYLDLVVEVARLGVKRRKAANLIGDLIYWKNQGIRIVNEDIELRKEILGLKKENVDLRSKFQRHKCAHRHTVWLNKEHVLFIQDLKKENEKLKTDLKEERWKQDVYSQYVNALRKTVDESKKRIGWLERILTDERETNDSLKRQIIDLEAALSRQKRIETTAEEMYIRMWGNR